MDLDYNFFDPENTIAPSKGKILISEPFLQDNYFKRSIVFLTEHSDEGSVGFVLNKPVNLQVNEVVADFPKTDALISLGGPVNTNTLHYIHTLGDIIPNSVRVIENIFWGGDFEVVKKLIQSKNLNKENIRFFLGYSGWDAGQLEGEIKENSWLVDDIDSGLLLKEFGAEAWVDFVKKVGKQYSIWENFPENPSLN